MTLVAEVLGFAVHVVAVHAVELVLVVRRDVRIRGLDALGLFNEILGVVALGAGLDVGSGRIGLVGAVRPMEAWRSAPNLPSAAAAVPAARSALMSMTASGRKCFMDSPFLILVSATPRLVPERACQHYTTLGNLRLG